MIIFIFYFCATVIIMNCFKTRSYNMKSFLMSLYVMEEIMNEWRSNFKIHFHIVCCRITAIVLILRKEKVFHKISVKWCKIFSSSVVYILNLKVFIVLFLLLLWIPFCHSRELYQKFFMKELLILRQRIACDCLIHVGSFYHLYTLLSCK